VNAAPVALIVLGGELAEEVALELTSRAKIILCADSGAEYARRLGLKASGIIGDLDSISPETLEFYRAEGAEIIQEEEQESNDFEKALRHLSSRYNGDVAILGMTGGRTDHALANLSAMLRYSDKFTSLIAYDRFGEHQFLTKSLKVVSLDCEIGTTVSLLPYGEAHGIRTENLKYPLLGESLTLGKREGLSNVTTARPVSISIERGALLVSIIRAK